MLTKGFYTALGTPLTEDGRIIESSLKKHIAAQIEAGASGLLLMGSMGIEEAVMLSEYKKAVDTAVCAVDGKIPLFVGAMDTSVAKVMEKVALMGVGKKIDGIVLTAPFYYKSDAASAVNFFRTVADRSPYPVYLYDLPSVAQLKIDIGIISKVIDHKNIKGMKSADWELIKEIERKFPNADFVALCSRLDSFDYMNQIGIDKNLDGMFACTPKTSRRMYDCMEKGDFVGARAHLDNILLLRDTMIAHGLMGCFTHCMNLLGYEGNFHQDFRPAITDAAKQVMLEVMKKIGEL